MPLSPRAAAVAALAVALGVAGACGGRTGGDGSAGSAGGGGAGGSGGTAAQGGVGALGGSTCVTAEGVRLCGGGHGECGWMNNDECPGGGCALPYDRERGGDAVAGLCFSDLEDAASRPCLHCQDGEVCIERKPGELYCVPESVCARLWLLGAHGVCRYADLAAYDARPLPVLAECPSTEPAARLCEGPCPKCPWSQSSCVGRSPDHPQGFCTSANFDWCALGAKGEYIQACTPGELCGVFRHTGSDYAVARLHGRCSSADSCLARAQLLPGGFDCYDSEGKLVSK
jgi:hypothetical protein